MEAVSSNTIFLTNLWKFFWDGKEFLGLGFFISGKKCNNTIDVFHIIILLCKFENEKALNAKEKMYCTKFCILSVLNIV